jgi:hypothetical protein
MKKVFIPCKFNCRLYKGNLSISKSLHSTVTKVHYITDEKVIIIYIIYI